MFRAATSALCNATNDLAVDNPLQWRLAVSGDVDNAFTATVDELAQEQAVQQGLSPVQQAQADAYFAILQRNIDAELARLDESGPVVGKAGT